MADIVVRKLDLSGVETWRYHGRVLRRRAHSIVLEAYFDKPDSAMLDVVLKEGDRFVETYFDNRYYNIFEIFDRDDSQFKGSYCNLSRPAQIMTSAVSWVDLALDLWVWPDGRMALLDEDEYNALSLEQSERDQVRSALRELQQDFEFKKPPV